MDTSSVFDRTDIDGKVLTDFQYNFVLGAALFWGFFVNWIVVKSVDPNLIISMGMFPFLIMYFLSCLLGIMLFTKSINPIVSFIGYNFVVVPFGLVLNIIVAAYDPELVFGAIKVTGFVVGTMMTLGVLFPRFFQSIENALTISLVLVVVYQILLLMIGGGTSGWLDWIVALIFCGYIGYDWGRANQIPKTVDNAIDSAAALYMDIVNLFVRVLSIMGDSDD